MSDDVVVVETSSLNGSAAATLTAGALLRQAREAAGLHVAALAVSMKVPVKKLEALEADRLDLLPDAVFVRALASSVCRTLKIDAAPVLQRLPQTSAPKLDTEIRGINAPFHAAGDLKGRNWPAFVTRPSVLWVAALLLGVLVVVFFPESRTTTGAADGAAVASGKDVQQQAPKDVMASPVVAQDSARPAPGAAEVIPPAAPMPAAAPASAAVVAAPPPVVIPVVAPPAVPASKPVLASALPAAPVTPSSAAVPSSGTVTLRGKGASWVEVTDAKGVVQIRKILAAGEVAYASGALPLSVVIGRVDMTQVEVRGQAFSLDAIAKDNVARFEVK